jgi:RNA polymerase sigma-70 factor (ECF subfamily)
MLRKGGRWRNPVRRFGHFAGSKNAAPGVQWGLRKTGTELAALDNRYDSWPGRVERESLWLLRLAMRLVRGEEHARELVQDTCVTALSRPPRNRRHPRAWLRRVMVNLVRQGARRIAVRGASRELEPHGEVHEDPPEGLLERDEVLVVLAEELDALEEPYQSTVKQHFLFGRSSVEIARRDSVPDGTVRWRLKRGLDRLRERLDARCRDRSAWVGALLVLLPRSESSPPATGRRIAVRSPFAGVALVVGMTATVLVVARALRIDSQRTSAREESASRAVPVAAAGNGASRPADEPRPMARERVALVSRDDPRAVVEDEASLDVDVVDADGRPLAEAEVQVAAPGSFTTRARTDASGRAAVPYSRIDIGAFGAPTARDRLTLRVRASGQAFPDVVSIDPAELPPGQALTLSSRGAATRLFGVVVDGSGRPVPDVPVTVFLDPNHRGAPGSWGEFRAPEVLGTHTDEAGRFAFPDRPLRRHILALSPPEHRMTMTMIEPAADGTLSGKLVLRDGGRVSGTVTLPDGRPAAGASVWYEPFMRGTEWARGTPGFHLDMHGFTHVVTADDEGSYELKGVPPGHRRVYAQAADQPDLITSCVLLVEGDAPVSWDAELQVSAPLRLRVVDVEGRPLAGWVLELTAQEVRAQAWRRRLETDHEGRALCHDAIGSTSVCVQAPEAPEVPVLTVELDPAASEQRIVVDLERAATLSGRVVASDGSPLRGELTLIPASGIPIPLSFDTSEGSFEARVEAGPYALMDVDPVAGRVTDLGVVRAPAVVDLTLRIPARAATWGPYPARLTYASPGQVHRVWEALPITRTLRVHSGLLALTMPSADGAFQTAWLYVEPGRQNVMDIEGLPGDVRVDLGPRCGRVTLTVRPDVENEPLGPGIERSARVWPARSGGVHHVRLATGDWTIEARSESGDSRSVRVSISGTTSGAISLDLQVQ